MTTDHIRQSIQTDRSVTEGQAIPTREIRAVYDEDTIRVYQAWPTAFTTWSSRAVTTRPQTCSRQSAPTRTPFLGWVNS